jgi:lipoprotein-anchoring transpeptidase ErfK/SrfK
MNRRFGAALLGLPLAAAMTAALPAASALAQYRSQEPYYAPPPGYQLDPNNPDVALRRVPRDAEPGAYGAPSRILPYPDDEEERLPPPGFATPQGQAQGPAQGPDRGPAQGPSQGPSYERGPQYDRAPYDRPRYEAAPGYGHQFDRQGPPPAAARGEPDVIRPPGAVGARPPGAIPQPVPPSATAALPPEDQPEQGPAKELPEHLKKQLVDFRTKEPAGTIIIDTANTYLYLILGGGKAMRYGIGVGRDGFTWTGNERISKMKEWPDWHPPPEMIERQPYLPRMMAGGPGNPLGARALYLGKTLYRIHGTNQPSTIGQTVSSGCIRLLNEDIMDLYNRVQVGSRVVVLPGADQPATAGNVPAGGQTPAASSQGLPRPQEGRNTGTAISGAPLPPPQMR